MTPNSFPPHKGALYLTHNEYKSYYQNIKDAVASLDCWASAEERRNSLDTGEIWELQWYPDTPVGFQKVAASTLEAVLEAAR